MIEPVPCRQNAGHGMDEAAKIIIAARGIKLGRQRRLHPFGHGRKLLRQLPRQFLGQHRQPPMHAQPRQTRQRGFNEALRVKAGQHRKIARQIAQRRAVEKLVGERESRAAARAVRSACHQIVAMVSPPSSTMFCPTM